ncbi:MAG: response regulator transcription factor [Cyanobacteriota bacterium]
MTTSELRTAAPIGTLVGSITPAEEKVLSAVMQGLSNRAIASTLVVSSRTVESHISHLFAKTGCRSRTQLALWGLTRPIR